MIAYARSAGRVVGRGGVWVLNGVAHMLTHRVGGGSGRTQEPTRAPK
jgi:hypothetical protein